MWKIKDTYTALAEEEIASKMSWCNYSPTKQQGKNIEGYLLGWMFMQENRFEVQKQLCSTAEHLCGVSLHVCGLAVTYRWQEVQWTFIGQQGE